VLQPILRYQRQRTKPKDIAYGLYLYFLGLSYRNTTAKALYRIIERSHVSIWEMDSEILTTKDFNQEKKD
jgi:hypothetical protein